MNDKQLEDVELISLGVAKGASEEDEVAVPRCLWHMKAKH